MKQRLLGRTLTRDRGQGWSTVYTPGIIDRTQSWGRKELTFPSSPEREKQTADALLLDFWPWGLRKNKFLLYVVSHLWWAVQKTSISLRPGSEYSCPRSSCLCLCKTYFEIFPVRIFGKIRSPLL